jgi:hypothetical protein
MTMKKVTTQNLEATDPNSGFNSEQPITNIQDEVIIEEDPTIQGDLGSRGSKFFPDTQEEDNN